MIPALAVPDLVVFAAAIALIAAIEIRGRRRTARWAPQAERLAAEHAAAHVRIAGRWVPTGEAHLWTVDEHGQFIRVIPVPELQEVAA